MAAASSAARPERYRVVAPLGESGTGRMDLARDPAGHLVALKTVHPRIAADPGFRERFRRETSAARSVHDVYAAAVLDADADAELPWLASEFCAGPSLVDTISTLGPMDSAALGTLGAALAQALGAVHAAGLVHRDLKPAHVVVSRTGPKILDFGTAKDTADGKLGFLAPEQLTGSAGAAAVGPPADVFALGALLTLSSTGRNPYGSGTARDVMHRTLHEAPDLLGVPGGEWQGFLRRCLAMDPADRPTGPEALAWCAGRAAGSVPWWLEEPILGVVREHEEALAELVDAGPELAEAIPEAFRTPARHAPAPWPEGGSPRTPSRFAAPRAAAQAPPAPSQDTPAARDPRTPPRAPTNPSLRPANPPHDDPTNPSHRHTTPPHDPANPPHRPAEPPRDPASAPGRPSAVPSPPPTSPPGPSRATASARDTPADPAPMPAPECATTPASAPGALPTPRRRGFPAWMARFLPDRSGH
ncbi:serine/threonine protein kinase [Streptomyces candidus]|uniref:Serine/threonine protein kinase n=1 Tax=Streptomyces candidus TaxID=67283 RepID=A0A7X0LMA5_9ACTN|nr:serine/threonine-protein kinase [Streptomyces candidus]MBB6433572.1 serine/threonine protein kinase [Streptomyces candidus]GHH35365.1 hypothetical protein GCM10018773_09110 [Streptomyces candidus]